MSAIRDNTAFIADLQRFLNRRHQQRLSEDGHAGTLTRTALMKVLPGFGTAAVAGPSDGAAATAVSIDLRSAGQIATLLPEVQPLARQLIADAAAKGIQIKIISGTRSYAEQDALYRQASDGRDNDGDGRTDEADERVTKARGGYSNHNFGIAFDIAIFEGARYLPESKAYAVVGSLGKALGAEWGGDWSSFKDEPHFQLRPKWARGLAERQMLAELRRRVSAKVSLWES